MGRDIRRVPANWQHPRGAQKYYSPTIGWYYGLQPMFDQTLEQAQAEWDEEKRKWDAGERPSYAKNRKDTYEEWTDKRPGNPDYYRPWKNEEATWFQLWETVTEGTPVTPAFETMEGLTEHLATVGEDYGNGTHSGPWGVERANAFTKVGWAPSGMIKAGEDVVHEPKDIPLIWEKAKNQ